jgi:hypothetical protein
MCVTAHYADTRKITDRICVCATRVHMCWTPRANVCVTHRTLMCVSALCADTRIISDRMCVCAARVFMCVRAARVFMCGTPFAYICVGRSARIYVCAHRACMYVLDAACV